MAVAGNLEVDVELNTSADKFFKLFSSQIHQIPTASSDKIHQIDVHAGDWETSGSVKLWSYTLDGKLESFKEKVEVDEANKSVTLIAVEGHVLEQYKSYKITLKAVDKNNGGSLVKINLEYEKFKHTDPPPNKYLNLAVGVVKDVDAHLVKQA